MPRLSESTVLSFQFRLTNIISTAEVLTMQKFTQSVRRVFDQKEGATMVEYGLMVALIAVVCLVAVTAVGLNIQGVFNQIAGAI